MSAVLARSPRPIATNPRPRRVPSPDKPAHSLAWESPGFCFVGSDRLRLVREGFGLVGVDSRYLLACLVAWLSLACLPACLPTCLPACASPMPPHLGVKPGFCCLPLHFPGRTTCTTAPDRTPDRGFRGEARHVEHGDSQGQGPESRRHGHHAGSGR